MKNKRCFVKPTALFLAVILMIFSFTACEYKPEPPEEDAFTLVMDFAQTTLGVGDTVTYKAILKNAEHESYTMKHSSGLIHLFVVKAEDYIDTDTHLLTDTVLKESNISPHGQVEEFCDFTPKEKGTYILKAYSTFTIEGKESTKDYFYECKKITITVV